MSNILVTGANGMIGSQLLPQLKDHQVWAIDKYFNNTPNTQYFKERYLFNKSLKNIHFIEMDINNLTLFETIFKNNKIDIVIHLAAKAGVAQSFKAPEETIEYNRKGFYHVLELAHKYSPQAHIIFASSSSIYGKNLNEKTHETSAFNPMSPYAVSKILNEEMAQNYAKKYHLKLTALRFFTVYGQYNRQDMFMHKVLSSLTHNTPFSLYYSGRMRRDFTYVQDVARVIGLLAEKEKSQNFQIFNVGRGQNELILDVVHLSEKIYGKCANYNIVQGQPEYDPTCTHCDNGALLAYLDNKIVFTSIEEGLERMIHWYKGMA